MAIRQHEPTPLPPAFLSFPSSHKTERKKMSFEQSFAAFLSVAVQKKNRNVILNAFLDDAALGLEDHTVYVAFLDIQKITFKFVVKNNSRLSQMTQHFF